MRTIPALFLLALTVYAVIDCARTDDRDMKAIAKPLWLLLIVIAPLIGPLAWLFAGKIRGDEVPRYNRQSAPAPDDNPKFLRKLDDDEWARRRRQARNAPRTGSGQPEPPSTPQDRDVVDPPEQPNQS